MKNKVVVMLSFIMVLIFLAGCGKNDKVTSDESATIEDNADKYYSDTPLENFETFTSITGIELSGKQDTENGSGRIYTYLFNNDADGMSAMLKYETYVKEYGFVEGDSNGSGMTFYNKDDQYQILLSMSQPQDSIIQYMVIVPHMTIQEQEQIREETQNKENEELANTQEEEYSKFVDLCKDGKYQEAKDFFNESSLYYNDSEGYLCYYLDSNDYWNYCSGMIDYEQGYYGEALDDFSNCETSVLELEKVKTDILNEISFLNGTYENPDTSAGYLSISISEGRVGTVIGATSFPTEAHYGKYIVKMTYNGEEYLGIGLLGDIEFVFTDVSDTSLTVKQAPESSFDLYEGKYKKVSDSPLDDEQ